MADNLLDKASILLTPTAYDNGRMLSVKPNENLYGSELVSNGDFATDSDWDKGNGTTISGGKANLDGSLSGSFQDPLRQFSVLTVGKKYKITFTISNYVSGAVVFFGNGSTEVSANGTYTQYITATITNLSFQNRAVPITCSIDNVSVVEDLSGDFTFSRNSAATRVNAQGLVENVQILSPELVSNGDFSQIGTEEVLNGNFSQEGSELVTNGDFATDSDWILTQATISNGSASFATTDGSFAGIRQNVFTVGKTYLISLEVSNLIGTAEVDTNGGASIGLDITTNGTKSFYMKADSTDIEIKRKFGAEQVISATIDNVSVKEVGQNWDFNRDWTVGENKIIHPAGSSPDYATQDNVLTIGKHYTYSVELLTGNGSNFAQLYVEGVGAIAAFTSGAGVYTGSFTASGTNIQIRAVNADIDVEVTNISVKEVGQDWTFGTNTTISEENGSLKAMIDGANGLITQVSVVDANKKYRASFDLKYISGIGAIKFEIGGFDSGFIAANLGENNTYTYDFTTTNTGSLAFRSGGNAIEGYITNISVKEITDDTDLPRINYSGFSYQDSLGSEQVVNGDFSTDISNWVSYGSGAVVNWNSNGYLEVNNSGNGYWCKVQQNNVFEIGKTYFIEIKAKSNIANKLFHNFFSDKSFSQVDTFETITGYYTATGTHFQFGYHNVSAQDTTITIDNISVKEYLGQEVVPDSGCGSWLLEPQSTNLIAYSEDFSNAAWSKQSNITPTYNTTETLSPDGTYNATKFVGVGSDGVFIQSNVTGVITRSVYLKSVTGTTNVVLKDPVLTQTAKTLTLNETWQRYDLSESNLHGSISGLWIDDIPSSGIYMWGAQIEALPYATSYIPTNGATNTRLQDLATNSGNASLINSTEGVLYAEISALADDGTNRIISLSENGNLDNRVNIFYTSGSNKVKFVVRVNNSNVFNDTITLSDIVAYNKIALKYKENDFAIWINGIKETEQLSGSTYSENTLDKLNFDQGSGSYPFYGNTKALAVYKEALTDAQLQSLTTI